MNIIKTGVFLGAVAALLGGASSARATIALETFVFEASSGSTNYNGSTITLDGTGSFNSTTFVPGGSPVYSFDFLNDGLSYTSGYVYSASVTGYNSTGWQGYFDVSTTGGGIADFTASYGTNDAITIPENDPPGTWTLETPGGVASTPDTASTCNLLLLGLSALGVGYRKFRASK